jgi:glycerophosphoryl diester phosphodiesterase
MLCIGHRGAMGHAPENTIASVHKAIALGAACIEIDVYSVEEHLIVFHDPSLERTTNGFGLLADHSFAELRSLNAGNGESIPTLSEVCRAVDRQVGINIELKGPHTAEPVVELIATQVKNGWDQALFLISSFDRQALETVRRRNRQLQMGLLTQTASMAAIATARRLNAYAVHPAADSLEPQWVETAHAHGLKVFAYTVNQYEEIRKMGQLGVDGVFTDFPERVVDRFGHRQPGWPPSL